MLKTAAFIRGSNGSVSRYLLLNRTSFSSECKEQWRDIGGCSNYQVSNLGNVINKKLNRQFKINVNRFKGRNRNVQVTLYDSNRNQIKRELGRLVLEHFKPPHDANELDNLFA